MCGAWVTVFGGSGFLGRHITRRLLADGLSVRVAVRRPERVDVAAFASSSDRFEAVSADVRDPDSVAAALDGAQAAVNCVGLYVERGEARFDAVHVTGAETVARQAMSAGATRLVHVSGIGADPASPSEYVASRGRGEQAVREAFAAATVLRPSVLFGPGDAVFTNLAGMAKILPVLPLFGAGDMRLQPVFVEDVADAVAAALTRDEACGRTYELGGPERYSYRALIELVLRQTGRRRVLLPLPFAVWEALATAVSVLPNPPLTRDQIALMRHDNVVGADVGTLADLGVTATPLEPVLPTYLR